MSAKVARKALDLAGLDLEALRTELEKNQQDLVKAGLLRRELLEERDSLKCELNALKENNVLLKNCLETQKEDSFRALQECKSVAGTKIAQLEEELEKSERSLSSKLDEPCLSTAELINSENEQLRDEISQLLKGHKDEMQVFEMKLEVREKENCLLKTELVNTKKQLEKMKEEKQELERSMSLKQHTCDRLSAELQLVKQEAENWEYQCLYNEQLLKTQDSELDDTRDKLQQLQQEVMNSKETPISPTCSTPVIKRATSSLFDELSDQDIPSGPRSAIASIRTQHIDRLGSCESNGSSLSPSEAGIVENCLKCMELQAGSVKLQEEIEVMKKQLLAVIKEKIKLHEQVEAWQSDVEEMFRSKVQVELDNLANDRQRSRRKLRGFLKGSKVADSTKADKSALKPSLVL